MLYHPLRILKTVTWMAALIGLAGAVTVAPAPVHGHHDALDQTPQRTLLQDACPGNLLVNPNFEGGARKTEDMGTSLSSSVAHGWFPWFIRGDQRFNREPEFKLEDATIDPLRWRVHDGYFSQKFFTTWATHTAGIYQRVPVRPGSGVNFTTWVQVYTGEADGWDGQKHNSDPDAPGNYRASIGIDPFGHTPPGAGAPPPDTVEWSAPIMIYDRWIQLSIRTTARGDHVTVYTRGQPEFSVKHNDSFWDAACLTVGGAPAAPPPAPPPAPAPINADAVVNTAALNFRAGPGTGYDIIGVLRQGDPLTVETRVADNSWLHVKNNAGSVGWVFTGLLTLSIDLAGVPVAQDIPPTPTPLPTNTPAPSPIPTETSLPTDTPAPTETSLPTETLSPVGTPEPTNSPVPLNVATPPATPEVMAQANQPVSAASEGENRPGSAAPEANAPAEPQPGGVPQALNCAPALIIAGISLLGAATLPRRRNYFR
jgi:uncharacterized protein YraI